MASATFDGPAAGGFYDVMVVVGNESLSPVLCDGSPSVDGPSTYLGIDGHVAADAGDSGIGTQVPTWLQPGTHSVDLLWGPIGCWESASGSATVSGIHMRVIKY